jgi:hypothetical protein
MPLGSPEYGSVVSELIVKAIPADGNTSAAERTHGYRAGSFQLPAAMVGTSVTVEVSVNGTNFSEVLELAASEANPVTVAANACFALPEKTFSFPWFRFKSNGTETSGASITVWMRG